MNNEQQKAKELAELLTAFADGKRLEYQSENLEWFGTTSLMYVADSVIDNKRQIRIKPETKRIALTQQDLIDRIKEGKTMWIKHNITNYIENIIAFTPMFVSLHSHIDSVEYPYLMELGTFLDNTPCYKEVEDE